jgi:hypothetical protein
VKPSQVRRLELVEDQTPEREDDLSAPWELLLTDELTRVYDSVRYGTLTDDEFQRWITIAFERQAAGLSKNDVSATLSRPREAFSQFERALRVRHKIVSTYRAFDVIDLEPEEITALAHLVAIASSSDELRIVADLIKRLRCYTVPMTVESFTALVLGGVMPAKPPIVWDA